MNESIKDKKKIEYQYSASTALLLKQLNCTIACTTYLSNKLFFLSSTDGKSIQLSDYFFDEPKGLAISENRIAIATFNTIETYFYHEGFNKFHSNEHQTFDVVFFPKQKIYTNYLDLHDLTFGKNNELFAVSADFSSIVRLDGDYHFTPYWHPPFISEIAQEDRCHLNGFTYENDTLKYATAFNNGNTPQSWREDILNTGILIDIETNEILLDNLSMPHSPRLINNSGRKTVIFLEAGKGQISMFDTESKKKETVIELEGFLRGLTIYNNYLFVGISKPRSSSTTSELLSITEQLPSSITIIDFKNRTKVGAIEFGENIEEIYEIEIIKGKTSPKLLLPNNKKHKKVIASPQQVFYKKKNEKEL